MCGALAIVVLYLTAKLDTIHYVWAFMLGAAVGDLIVALSFEAVAPTHVTVSPGERVSHDSPLSARARVVAEFSADGSGKVSVRGEVWNARCMSIGEGKLSPGQEVHVTGRDGLTLLIDRIGA